MISYTDTPDFPCVISKFEKHTQLKNDIIKAIRKTSSTLVNKPDEVINTDWYADKNIIKYYLAILLEPFSHHMQGVFDRLKHKEITYIDFWFTEYKKNYKYYKHQHLKTSWVSIYYLQLPKNTPITNFHNIFNDDVFIPKIKEGDIFTFPGFIWHWSPVNISNKNKIVISCNVA